MKNNASSLPGEASSSSYAIGSMPQDPIHLHDLLAKLISVRRYEACATKYILLSDLIDAVCINLSKKRAYEALNQKIIGDAPSDKISAADFTILIAQLGIDKFNELNLNFERLREYILDEQNLAKLGALDQHIYFKADTHAFKNLDINVIKNVIKSCIMVWPDVPEYVIAANFNASSVTLKIYLMNQYDINFDILIKKFREEIVAADDETSNSKIEKCGGSGEEKLDPEADEDAEVIFHSRLFEYSKLLEHIGFVPIPNPHDTPSYITSAYTAPAPTAPTQVTQQSVSEIEFNLFLGVLNNLSDEASNDNDGNRELLTQLQTIYYRNNNESHFAEMIQKLPLNEALGVYNKLRYLLRNEMEIKHFLLINLLENPKFEQELKEPSKGNLSYLFFRDLLYVEIVPQIFHFIKFIQDNKALKIILEKNVEEQIYLLKHERVRRNGKLFSVYLASIYPEHYQTLLEKGKKHALYEVMQAIFPHFSNSKLKESSKGKFVLLHDLATLNVRSNATKKRKLGLSSQERENLHTHTLFKTPSNRVEQPESGAISASASTLDPLLTIDGATIYPINYMISIDDRRELDDISIPNMFDDDTSALSPINHSEIFGDDGEEPATKKYKTNNVTGNENNFADKDNETMLNEIDSYLNNLTRPPSNNFKVISHEPVSPESKPKTAYESLEGLVPNILFPPQYQEEKSTSDNAHTTPQAVNNPDFYLFLSVLNNLSDNTSNDNDDNKELLKQLLTRNDNTSHFAKMIQALPLNEALVLYDKLRYLSKYEKEIKHLLLTNLIENPKFEQALKENSKDNLSYSVLLDLLRVERWLQDKYYIKVIQNNTILKEIILEKNKEEQIYLLTHSRFIRNGKLFFIYLAAIYPEHYQTLLRKGKKHDLYEVIQAIFPKAKLNKKLTGKFVILNNVAVLGAFSNASQTSKKRKLENQSQSQQNEQQDTSEIINKRAATQASASTTDFSLSTIDNETTDIPDMFTDNTSVFSSAYNHAGIFEVRPNKKRKTNDVEDKQQGEEADDEFLTQEEAYKILRKEG